MFMIGSAVSEGRAAPPKPRSQQDPEKKYFQPISEIC
jgi:hypothetical protein